MLITVFTPTYNRGRLLRPLFESLCGQAFDSFEWLIVDDGSTDDTKDIVNGFCKAGNHFPIRYVQQENLGKHQAINRGVAEAKGEYFFIVDSDDRLPVNALQKVAQRIQTINGDPSLGGVCGLDATFDGTVIGTGFPEAEMDDTALNIRFLHHVMGDLKEVFRTDVLREFPFPSIDGERFCPEALVWNRIATKYKLRCINEIIYLVEYQTDGISSNIVKVRMQSPVASMLCYQELTTYNVPVMVKIKAAINYWRFRLCAKRESARPSLRWYWNWTMPLGYLMHLRDKLKIES